VSRCCRPPDNQPIRSSCAVAAPDVVFGVVVDNWTVHCCRGKFRHITGRRCFPNDAIVVLAAIDMMLMYGVCVCDDDGGGCLCCSGVWL
jgi:hypothetical protein